MSTKAIRVDDDVMNTLADKREGFETPNECLKRILQEQNTCHVRKMEGPEEPEDDES